MEQIEKNIEKLVGVVPYKLPTNVKDLLVKFLPWIALIGALVMLISTIVGVQALLFVSSVFGGMMYSGYYSGLSVTSGIWFMAWVSLALVAVQAVLYVVAFAPLQQRRVFGWRVLLWASLVNVLSVVASLLYNIDILSFVVSAAAVFVGWYLLFQVRSQFTKK